jgi:hypothetical protein
MLMIQQFPAAAAADARSKLTAAARIATGLKQTNKCAGRFYL